MQKMAFVKSENAQAALIFYYAFRWIVLPAHGLCALTFKPESDRSFQIVHAPPGDFIDAMHHLIGFDHHLQQHTVR